MVSNKLTHRRTTISNPKICKSKLKPLRPLQPEPPPQWPPPFIRATIKCSGPYETRERDLTLYPNYPQNPTRYDGYSNDGYAYASTFFQLGQAQSTVRPYHIYMWGDRTYWFAYYGQQYTVPNTAFAFFNTNWQSQDPKRAEIRLILAYP